eukprot:CCRYP_015702-RA/>CCRYP_015702-RA protein AED:0.02 eAED:0.02 QI:194/1/1/1/1/1/2/358/821
MNTKKKTALVFGISGDQGQFVTRGLLDSQSYDTVYGVTHAVTAHVMDVMARRLDVKVVRGDHVDDDGGEASRRPDKLVLLQAELSDPSSLRNVLETTRATDVFLVTATDIPPTESADASLHDSEEREYETIRMFFDVLVSVHREEWEGRRDDRLERHVVFSMLENVRGLVEWLEARRRTGSRSEYRQDGSIDDDVLLNIKPLDDGGIVPHYTGKGRGGEYALSLIHGLPSPWEETTDPASPSPFHSNKKATPSIIPGLSVTLITLPFLHSNFTASATPLPVTTASSPSSGRGPAQWSISACLGDPSHPMDMLSVSDLQYIVPVVFRHPQKYQGRNIRLSAEKITMDEVAYQFADLFGKDVIYSPLTVEEMSSLEVPGAPAFAQMCQFLASSYAHGGDVEETAEIIKEFGGREPQTFQDWLLTHSDEEAFERVGLTVDATPIQCVAVFNATYMQGKSVIKGLLADSRKKYSVRACICTDHQCHDNQQERLEAEAQSLIALDPERVTVHFANLDDVDSCTEAVKGADGVFAVTDFYSRQLFEQLEPCRGPERGEQEEKRARNVIDACAAAGTVRHVVLSTLESVEDVDKELKDADGWVVLDKGGGDNVMESGRAIFDGKTRMAAYARTKNLSVTYVLMPVYSESFFRALAMKIRNDIILEEQNDGESSSDEDGEKVVCMSVDELGPAVANIMDSYEVFAGHEIALMTDVLSLREASGIIKEVFFMTKSATVTVLGSSLEPCVTVNDTSTWTATTEEEPNMEYKLDTFAKDLGSMFRFMNKSEAVKRRQAVARTMELVPDIRTFRQWLEDNRDNVEFREMLGIR